ncbi:UNVERIFIED_ORG: hypothetical protein J2W19_002652 [Shinella zoogloeoides]|nr:hypothetical protein [Shinella zoogloeoides]
MPKFYFHIRTALDFHVDVDGRELQSSDHARLCAIEAIREALSQCIARGRTIDGRVFEITDESGNLVEVVSFNEAIRDAQQANVRRREAASSLLDSTASGSIHPVLFRDRSVTRE